ncbi:MAG: hypothetical protein ABL998_22865, partial [Planctomycetota bacterium]
LVLVLLGLVGVVARPRRAAFPAILSVVCVGFAQAWPILRWLYHVPGFDLGAPGRVLALTWFLWPWLAALGVEALLARAPRALATLIVASFAVALGASLAWRGLEPAEFARGIQDAILARYPGLVTQAEVLTRLPLERCLAAAEHLAGSLARAFAGAAALFVAGMLALFLDRRPGAFEEGPRRRALVLGLALPLLAGLLPFLVLDGFGARGPLALLSLSGIAALAVLALATPRAELALWFPPLALLVLEGFLGAYGHVGGRRVLSEGLFPPSPTLEVVREAAGDGRVLRLDPSGNLSEAVALARPNMLVPYGIADLTPYPTFTPKTAVELARALDPRMSFKNHVAPLPELAQVDAALLDLLRVTCVLSVRPLQHARLVPVMERAGFCVYQRLGALPAARIVPRAVLGLGEREILAELAGPAPDYAGRVRLAPEEVVVAADLEPVASVGTITAVEHPAKNRAVVRVSASTGGWLVLHEQWAPGWKCFAGEQELRVYRADHAYRAVPLPTGDLVLEFHYEPRSLDWGLALSLGALLLVLGYELLNRN